jgi:hypothetical protein
MALLVHDDRAHLGGRERVDHELRGLIGDHRMMSTRSPASSCVTACTREPRMPTQVPTGSMRWSLDPHRDLGAQPRVARRGLDLEEAFLDLGHLELEQLHQELGRDARQDQLRAARLAVDLGDVGAHAIADAQVLLGIMWSRGSRLRRGPTPRSCCRARRA